MKTFFDTSVLVAASVRAHPHHTQTLPVLQRVITGRDAGFIGAHTIAELYAALTSVPVLPRIHPSDAARIITQDVLPHFEVVAIDKNDYVETLLMIADGGWAGAKIYDALLLRCAGKSKADRIYTLNVSDFRALAETSLQPKICSP